jgi:hypothetical protein
LAEKIWYVWISGKQEGPFSLSELKRMKELTPDTWAWKPGMLAWLPIRKIPELKELFEEELPQENAEIQEPQMPEEDAALALPYAEPPWLFWFLIALVLVLYALFLITRP